MEPSARHDDLPTCYGQSTGVATSFCRSMSQVARVQPGCSQLSFLDIFRMETFPNVAAEVLSEFQALLEHSPPPIGSTRMLQLMAINMFAVYNSQPKGTDGEGWALHSITQVSLILCGPGSEVGRRVQQGHSYPDIVGRKVLLESKLHMSR